MTTSAIQRLKARWWVPAILLCAVLLIALVAKHAYHDYHPTAAEAAKSHVLFVALHETGNKVRLDVFEPWEWDRMCILLPYDMLSGTPFSRTMSLPYDAWINAETYWGLVFFDSKGRVELTRIPVGEMVPSRSSARCVSRLQEPYLETIGNFHSYDTREVRLDAKKKRRNTWYW